MIDWNDVKSKFKIGDVIEGKVLQHAPFGIFLDLNYSGLLGLVQITDFLDEGVMLEECYPKIGSLVKVAVIAYTEDNRNQIWCSKKPSVIKQNTFC